MKLLLGDCIDVIRTLVPESFDTVIADPPYGVNYRYNPGPRNAVCTHELGTKIANDQRPYIWWLHEAYKATKPGGALICYCATTTQDDFKRAIELAGYTIRSHVIWDKNMPGMGNIASAFAPQHEVIWFATKGKFQFPHGRPRSVLRFTRINGGSLHPHQKPLELQEYLLRAVTPDGGKVLDPFMGCGSAGEAARNCGYDYTGIEIDPKWYEVAEQYLSQCANKAA